MSDTRRTKADLIVELESLRSKIETQDALRDAGDLERREARTRYALTAAGGVLIETDDTGNVTWASPSLAEVLGYQPEEITAPFGLDWVHPEDRDTAEAMHRELPSNSGSGHVVCRAQHKSGHWIWFEIFARATRTIDGANCALAYWSDVTRLRLSDEHAREVDSRFNALTENASDMISEVDETGILRFTTPNCEAILGYPAEDLIGQSMLDAGHFENVHPDDQQAALEAMRRGIEGDPESESEYRYRHADGSWRWLHSRARTFRTRDGELRFLTISRDVTERVRDQLALRQSEERYRVLAETTHDLVIELDPEGCVVYVSPNSESLIGRAPEEIVGTTPFSLVHPDDMDRAVNLFLSRLEPSAPSPSEPFRVRHRDGSWRLIEGGGFNYRTNTGAMHMVGVIRDLTESRAAELERDALEERMQQAQRLEGLGVMAGGVAHDFNNLLTPILGDASLALMDLPPDSPIRIRLQNIQKAARKAAELTGQMLAYAGVEAIHVEMIDLSQLVRELGRLINSAVSRKAHIGFELESGLPPIEADASQMSQVAMNLIANASESLGDGEGRVDIRTGQVELDETELGRLLLGDALPAGCYVFVEVSDTGCGIDPELRSRIFDPFFSTKFTGRGLGLAAVLGIVRGHRAAVEIDGGPGVGTRFRVLFPAARRVTARTASAVGTLPLASVAETILIADDDDGVRELTEETLRREGLRVLCASDGREAVDLFREHRDEICVVLLDRTMPGSSGEEAFDAIRAIRPDVPIILISGYSRASVPVRFASEGLAGFLQKPFMPEALVAKIRGILEK